MIAGSKTGEIEIRTGSGKVITASFGECKEIHCHLGTYNMTPIITAMGMTVAVSKKAGIG